MPIPPKDFILPFVRKEQVAKDAWTFYFDRVKRDSAGPEDFDFLPGQYIRMTFDIMEPDERGTGRFFSITSSPLNKEYLTITTRILQSAFKKTLASLSPGTDVKFFGPVGRFLLDEDDKRPRIFLAGGIGITPFHSMLTYASEKNLLLPITLFVSFSTVEEIVFYDELQKISEDHPNIKVIYTVTRPEVIPSAAFSTAGESEIDVWTGETGRISVDLIKKYAPDFVSSLFYISGPPMMVDAMLALVKEMGVPDEQVKKEKFVGY